MNNVIEKYCNFFIAHFGLNIAKYRQRNYYSIFFKTNIQYITMKHLFILIVVCFTSATSFANSNSINNNSDSANYYYAKAKESRSQRKVFDAEKFFQKALEFDANNDEIRIEFAEY